MFAMYNICENAVGLKYQGPNVFQKDYFTSFKSSFLFLDSQMKNLAKQAPYLRKRELSAKCKVCYTT